MLPGFIAFYYLPVVKVTTCRLSTCTASPSQRQQLNYAMSRDALAMEMIASAFLATKDGVPVENKECVYMCVFDGHACSHWECDEGREYLFSAST